MEVLSPPTAREVYLYLNQGREFARLFFILGALGLSAFLFFRSPWEQDSSGIALFIQSGVIVMLIGGAFWQVKMHEHTEKEAWLKAWEQKIELAGLPIAMKTLSEGRLDPDSRLAIQSWIARRFPLS